MNQYVSDGDNYGSDEDVAENHVQLIDAVSKLDRTQHIKRPTRNEPTIQSGEFHLVKSDSSKNGAVSYTDLVKVLGKTAKHAEIGRQLRTTQKKTKTLRKPLEKPQAERIQRAVGYENVKKQLGKWDAIVTANRVAPHRSFPINQADISMKPSSTFLSKFRIKTDLEKELEALKPVENEIDDNKDQEFPLTLEEIIEHRKEAAKLRAQQSYREAKARRQNKIKSKKYHRIEKRNKIKKKLKELEILQKTNPEAALQQLEELEKTRAGERASLRHHSTGKWAQNLQIRAKHDTESRAELAQQLSIYRDLTQKVKLLDSSESEGEEELDNDVPQKLDLQNPWTQEKNEVNEFISGYRKFWSNKNEESNKINNQCLIQKQAIPKATLDISQINTEIHKKKYEKANSNLVLSSTTLSKSMNDIKDISSNATCSDQSISTYTSSWIVTDVNTNILDKKVISKEDTIDNLFENLEESVQCEINRKLNKLRNKVYNQHSNNISNNDIDSDEEYEPDLSFKNSKKRPIIDAKLDETSSNKLGNSVDDYNHLKKQCENINLNNISSNNTEGIDPNKFMNLQPKTLLNGLSDLDVTNDMIDDDPEKDNRQMIIAEAFEEDDIVTDFQKEKQDTIDKDKPQDINLFLPGWGSWGGKDIKNKHKRKRFTIKCPKKIPRKDENRGDLIINENPNAKLKTHMVSELPFPFTSVSDFEASVRAPIGNTFIPVNASKKLTRPAITSKLGAIIDPMDEHVLVKKKNYGK